MSTETTFREWPERPAPHLALIHRWPPLATGIFFGFLWARAISHALDVQDGVPYFIAIAFCSVVGTVSGILVPYAALLALEGGRWTLSGSKRPVTQTLLNLLVPITHGVVLLKSQTLFGPEPRLFTLFQMVVTPYFLLFALSLVLDGEMYRDR